MIRAGWLSAVAGYRVETDVDLSRVRTRMGDFVASQLSRAVNVKARNDLVVEVYKDHLTGRQTICFCVDVAHTLSLAGAFRSSGVAVASVTGETAPPERKKALDDFARGRVRVLTNCMVLTEGYDESSVAGIVLARPTRSSLLYTQMVGRGTRLHPGKKDLTVIDIVDVTRGHKLVTLPSLFGLSQEFDLQGRTTTEVQDALRWVESNRPWVRADLAVSLTDLRYRCEKIDLLELELPEELYDCATFAWTAVGKDVYRLGLGGGESVVAASTIIGKWEVTLHSRGRETVIAGAADAAGAIRLAERFVREKRRDSVGLVLRGTRWRREPASEKQLRVLRKGGMEVPRGLAKGQASHLIAMLSKDRPRGRRDAPEAKGSGA